MPPRRKPRKSSKSRRNGGKSGNSHHLRLVLAGLFLLGFLVGALVFLSHLSESLRQTAVPAAPLRPTETEPPAPPAPEVGNNPAAVLDDIRVEMESALLRTGVSLGDLTMTSPASGEVRLEVRGEFPPSGILTDLEKRLLRIDAGIRLERRPAEGTLQILWQGAPRFLLVFHSPLAAVPPVPEKPRVAIVMDDLGRDLATARALVALDLPVTFAVLPGEPHAAEVAEIAHRQKREILIHIPMEPQGYPVTDPGDDALLTGMADEEIRRRMEGFRQRVPHAVGGNNHMGSRFTENRDGMQAVLGAMAEADLFFLDSLTSGRSVAYAEARRAQIPAAVRDVFLDNEPQVEKIAAQIRRLAGIARRQGHAVGICHPYPQTLEALRREATWLRQEGVEVVPVSRLLVR